VFGMLRMDYQFMHISDMQSPPIKTSKLRWLQKE